MSVESSIYVAYALTGPLCWSAYSVLIFSGRRRLMLLKKNPTPLPGNMSPPSVSILVPAKDEGERIRGCLQSCLDQDYADFEVIAIDDRSADQTGQVMDEMAAADPRLRVVHVPHAPLTPGWTGKNNALYTGQKLARGEWLLFVDSDVILKPAALPASISVVLNKRFDLISLLPELESHSLWESLLVPLAAGAAAAMYAIALNNMNNKKHSGFANGQFLMISRTVYDAVGGHDTVKDRYCEDVALALILKESGYRPRVAIGNDWSKVRMYSSLASIFRGWSRIYYAARVGSPWRPLAAVAFLMTCCFTVPAALAWGLIRHADPRWFWLWTGAAALHAGVMLFMVSQYYAWSGNPRRNAFLFPIAGPMLMGILCRSLWMCVTKKVTWRGTSYQHVMVPKLVEPPRAG